MGWNETSSSGSYLVVPTSVLYFSLFKKPLECDLNKSVLKESNCGF